MVRAARARWRGATMKLLLLLISIAVSAMAQVTIGVPSSSGPAQQPAITLSIATPYNTDVSGTITLTYASSVGGDDLTVRFSNGTRTLSFTIPKGQTQAVFTPANPAVIIGTVAGTITLTASLTDPFFKDVTTSTTINVTP